MSNNAWVTADGGEMGRAQAVQAEACGLIPTVQMNPILLKPSGSLGSQVIVLGRAEGHCSGANYYQRFEDLWSRVRAVIDEWRTRCDVLLMEGAGSPVELNLLHKDLVNLRPCHYVDGKWLFIGDIDRGGIFAQLTGFWSLLTPEDRARSLGAIVNRFRGDLALFQNPQQWLTPHAPGLEILGTLPYRADLRPEEEDGLCDADVSRGEGDLIAWIQFPHLSNLTDVQPWWHDRGVRSQWVTRADEIKDARVIVLPGSKNTIADLEWLRLVGLADAVVSAAARGVLVIGICGGYQMLGKRLIDTHGVAGNAGTAAGLGLLPTETVFSEQKTLRQVVAKCGAHESPAYEIHMGTTRAYAEVDALHEVEDEAGVRAEGIACANVWGTYLHGWFDSPHVRRRVATAARLVRHHAEPHSWAEQRQRVYTEMAQHLAQHIDLDPVRRYLGLYR